MNQLVINWHILEACNFGCHYCFAHWPPANSSTEIWRATISWQKMLDELRQLPKIMRGHWSGIRLNLAGGEPLLLYKKGVLGEILDYADDIGFDLSIISNAYLMDDEFIKAWGPKLHTLGISVDSLNIDTNAKIGRCTKSNSKKQISSERVAEIFRLAREINPGIKCKLNTVVSTNNCHENLHFLIRQTTPDRWKVFKMLPLADTLSISEKQVPHKITDQQFDDFLDRHKDLKNIMVPEDNDAMTDSYIMVDPMGRFYQNEVAEDGYKHVVSKPLHEIGIEKAFEQISFDKRKYEKRYIPIARK